MKGDKPIALKHETLPMRVDTTAISILYVDDEKINLRIFKLLLRRIFDIHVAESATDALGILKKEEIHILVSDQIMSGMNGTELLEKVETDFPKITRMLLTGDNHQMEVQQALKEGKVFACINKPFDERCLTELFIEAYKAYLQK